MKLHGSVIKRLIRLFTTYGGHRSELRLQNELKNLNLAIYTQQTGKQVIVESSELAKAIQDQNR